MQYEGLSESGLRMLQRHELSPLDIHLQESQAHDFRHVVQSHRLHRLRRDHLAPEGEAMKQVQHIWIRFEQGCHVPRGADMERSETAVSDRMRKKWLARTRLLLQCRKGLGSGFESDQFGLRIG